MSAYIAILIGFLTLQACGKGFSANNSVSDIFDKDTTNPCCVCGGQVGVSLIVRNHFQEPHWEIQTTVTTYRQTLLKYLERAADINPQFKFSSEYHGTLGHMITKINGVAASLENKTFWHTSALNIDAYDSLDLGVSSHMPLQGDVIMFNFTTWATSHV